ncbi:HlyD family efflux transporter periplasmic adaptor subunit [Pseudogemmatithrix spongiicola]|uniref:HlyD family efflux transporter periplasmic adaptor subunit n=1 Tax=Pseudogemmatithrix spongiicola TaxID=3062599 RepID=A0AA49JWU0_9BACT|nr:HlyD family efflux transporter periplasmic adaptor subunit [Gemmatimonadaceae bacterium 'strain 138']WKW15959.1 HlyD family efflux transporter periplasmic adaptor subunit [Gemmatimonadaceae bacterium 'strain 318']
MATTSDLLDRRDASLESVRLLARQPSLRTLLMWIGGVLGIMLIVAFLPWQQNVAGAGEVTALQPADRPQEAVAAIGGRISEWYVQEGDSVKVGDPIVALAEVKQEYLDPLTLDRLGEQVAAKRRSVEEKRAKAAALADQAIALDSLRTLARIRADNRIQQITASLAAAQLEDSIATVQAERIQQLEREGLRSRAELEMARQRQQRAAALAIEQRAALLTVRAERSAVDADYAEKIAKVESDRRATLAEVADGIAEIAKLATGEANMSERQDLLMVRAPRDGIVVRALRAGIGEVVKDGEAVATVQAANPELAVALQVNARDVPLIRVGDEVRLEFAGWPALQFSGWPNASLGTFGGRVAVVDQVALPNGYYRVLVAPDSAQPAWPRELLMGSGVRGWAMLREVRVWFEVWRTINGFPPAVPQSGLTPTSGGSGYSGTRNAASPAPAKSAP